MGNVSAKDEPVTGSETSTPPSGPATNDQAGKSNTMNFDYAAARSWNPTALDADAEKGKQEIPIRPMRVDTFQRIYHNVEDSPYFIPADIAEGKRLNLQHMIFRQSLGSNYAAKDLTANLEKGIKVLDVGTGTGFWCVEMGQEFPNSQFYGVDITLGDWSMIAEQSSNVFCLFGNVLDKLPFEDNTFDYVHQRMLVTGLPKDKWPQALQELKRVTKPGGYLELFETDMYTRDAGPKLEALCKVMLTVITLRGVDPSIVWSLSDMMGNAGYVNIKDGYISIPIGWDGLVGEALAKDGEHGFGAIKGILTPFLKITPELYDQMLKEAFDDARTKYKGYGNFYWAVGIKPN